MFGFINLHKPPGFTSHDCVAKLRKLLNTKKIGHGGTLDPNATGVLPIAVGKATKLLQFLPATKAYRAQIRLGVTTTTDDLEGEIIQITTSVNLDPNQIRDCLSTFLGTINQIPPIYSAIKKDGKKLYELARKGIEIELEPRTVTIYKIDLINIELGEYCELEVDIRCSPGTYIRAIARDLGEILGVGGTLANLVRTESCGMHLAESITFQEIEGLLVEESLHLIDPSSLLQHLVQVTLDAKASKLWCQGQLIDLAVAIAVSTPVSIANEHDYLVTYQEDQTFLGISILFFRENVLKIKPKIVFPLQD